MNLISESTLQVKIQHQPYPCELWEGSGSTTQPWGDPPEADADAMRVDTMPESKQLLKKRALFSEEKNAKRSQ